MLMILTAHLLLQIRKERADYIRDMELEYRKGNLDPAPETFLRRKFDEMEASGDKIND